MRAQSQRNACYFLSVISLCLGPVVRGPRLIKDGVKAACSFIPFVLCYAGVTGLLPALPASCSPGTLGKQTKPSPGIRLKCGKGICDSHWSGKGSRCGLSRWENTKHVAYPNRKRLWREFRAAHLCGLERPSSRASWASVQHSLPSLCGMHAAPKAMASGSSLEP